MTRVLLAVAAVLAGAGAFLARSQSLTWLIVILAGPAVFAALFPSRRVRAGGLPVLLLLTAAVAAELIGYAVWDSLVDLPNGILFWWPAVLAAAAFAAHRRTARLPVSRG